MASAVLWTAATRLFHTPMASGGRKSPELGYAAAHALTRGTYVPRSPWGYETASKQGSSLETFGMILVPVPGCCHDRFDVGVAGPPAELLLNPVRGREQLRGIAGAARAFLDGDVLAGRLLDGAD